MLEVYGLEEAQRTVREFARAHPLKRAVETIPATQAAGRIIAADVHAPEDVPGFNRSTVDGMAVFAADTFGASEALPALLTVAGAVAMGKEPAGRCEAETCWEVPTGGMLPEGADAMVMIEHVERYADGTAGILKAVAPRENVVLRGDELQAGDTVLTAGTQLMPHHLGALAATGVQAVDVMRTPKVAIISIGDELVDPAATPALGQMRDVNTSLLAASVEECGAQVGMAVRIADGLDGLRDALREAGSSCDMVLVSGGSSVGERDVTAQAIAELGSVMFHGLALKPGKPTIFGQIDGVPAFGLPGHPVAAYLVFRLLAAPVLHELGHLPQHERCQHAQLTETLPSNHGRTECVPVAIDGSAARPIRMKSGLISLLCQADGYVIIPRNSEGIAAGNDVDVHLFGR